MVQAERKFEVEGVFQEMDLIGCWGSQLHECWMMDAVRRRDLGPGSQ